MIFKQGTQSLCFTSGRPSCIYTNSENLYEGLVKVQPNGSRSRDSQKLKNILFRQLPIYNLRQLTLKVRSNNLIPKPNE